MESPNEPRPHQDQLEVRPQSRPTQIRLQQEIFQAVIDLGQFRVDWNFVENGTACSNVTAGGVTFLLTWTDDSRTRSAVSLPMFDASSLTATSGSFHFATTKTNAWASGTFTIQSTGAIIQYATGYTACTTGTGTYEPNATVTRLQ
jgi:hypothetical protein